MPRLQAEEKQAVNEVEVSLVVPLYNEEPTVPLFVERAIGAMRRLSVGYEIICVNDGSSDATLASLMREQAAHPEIVIVDLSRNFGKEAALTAGLHHARGRAVIPIDCDMQDPPEMIETLLAKWREGFEIVLARRADRASDSGAKRVTAEWFYRVYNRLSDLRIPEDVGDFRLLDRRVVDALNTLPERQRFMKGLFAWVGFRSAVVDYVREPRTAGQTKFTGWRLWNLALEGITSFSTLPLRVWTYFGAIISLLAFLYGTFLVVRTLILGGDVPGYASTLTVILFLGGVQLVGIGMLGEYIGRIYMETKERPIYVVRNVHRSPR